MRKKQGLKKPQETNITEHDTKGTNLDQVQRVCTSAPTLPHTGGKNEIRKLKNKVG